MPPFNVYGIYVSIDVRHIPAKQGILLVYENIEVLDDIKNDTILVQSISNYHLNNFSISNSLSQIIFCPNLKDLANELEQKAKYLSEPFKFNYKRFHGFKPKNIAFAYILVDDEAAGQTLATTLNGTYRNGIPYNVNHQKDNPSRNFKGDLIKINYYQS